MMDETILTMEFRKRLLVKFDSSKWVIFGQTHIIRYHNTHATLLEMIIIIYQCCHKNLHQKMKKKVPVSKI